MQQHICPNSTVYMATGLLVGSVSIFFFSLFVIQWLMNRRNASPVNWPLIGMIPALITNGTHIHDYVASVLHELSGCTWVFHGPWGCGMDFLVTCNPANTNHVLNQNFANYPKGEDFYEIFDILGDGIFNVDGELWRDQRRMVQSLMGGNKFRTLVSKCTSEKINKGLLPLLNLMADSGKAFDLSDVMLRFTFDTTCSLVLGVDPGSVSPDLPTIPFAEAMAEAEHVLMLRHMMPRICWKLLRMLRLGPERKMLASRQVIDRYLAQVITERREKIDGGATKEGHADMLTSYMEESMTMPITDKFLRDSASALLAAGKDTTGVALSWLIWLVSKNPHVEERIRREVEEMEQLTIQKIEKLIYLHAAVCETLRLYPSVPSNHKQALQTDVLPSGHKINKGGKVLIYMYAMGRMETVWGKDCLEFKPERWITEEGKLRHEPSYKFSAFNSGPRTCLGKDMAFTQIKLVAALVIYNFHVHVPQGCDVEPDISIVLGMKNGMMVKLSKRNGGGASLMSS